jgi:hypothetical protein
MIYAIALCLSAFSLPSGQQVPGSLKERLVMAHENLQANLSLSNIRISMHMDFYTALLKVGFMALTAASEAVYLNEGREVVVKTWTWLDDDRLKELERSSHDLGALRDIGAIADDSLVDGVGLVEEKNALLAKVLRNSRSGYAKERTTQKVTKRKSASHQMRRDGIGANERTGRWLMAYGFFKGIFWLVIGWVAKGLVKLLTKIGITYRPRWLSRLTRREKKEKRPENSIKSDLDHLQLWMLSDDGRKVLPGDERICIEREMRKRVTEEMGSTWTPEHEKTVNDRLYGWWLSGGLWGGDDSSGNYAPPERDDDLTSVISETSTTVESDDSNAWESESEPSSGQMTPTLADPSPMGRRDVTLDPQYLAQLLAPKTPAQKEESRYLSQHLSHRGILTRSRFRTATYRDRTEIFHGRPGKTPLSTDDEAELLELIILSRRSKPGAEGERPWTTGSEGLGAAGPFCVVCQSASRSVIVWPCRCLSLCDDCRVSLAMNNFDKCVCCRRDVLGFSRIYVP